MTTQAAAARALRAIDEPRAQIAETIRSQWQRNRVGRTPEMRLLQEHYALLGEQDAKEIARLDPSQHLHHCRCHRCDTSPQNCPLCEKVCSGTFALAAHLRWHERAAKRERARWEELSKSGSLAVLASLLGDPVRASQLDLRTLRDLDNKLRAALYGFGTRRTRRPPAMRSLRAAISIYADQPTKLHKIQGQFTGDVATLITRLALVAGVGVSTVMAALTLYGLEGLAKALRATKAAPTPHAPGNLTQPAAPIDVMAFPSAEETDE